MKKSVLVNEVFFPRNEQEDTAIRVTDDSTIRTIRMKPEVFEKAFPKGITEGSRILIDEGAHGEVIGVSPERWFPVVKDLIDEPKSDEYSSSYEYI